MNRDPISSKDIMKNPFDPRAPSFDADAINETIRRALASAGLDTTTGPMHQVTETIRRALAAGRLANAEPSFGSEPVIDVSARVVSVGDDDGNTLPGLTPSTGDAQQCPGRFEAHAFSNGAGHRANRVYVPEGRSQSPRA